MDGCSLQHVFRSGMEAFSKRRALHPRESTAARCISGCYTVEMGAHSVLCPNGDYEALQFHACRHRSCPRCADAARSTWIDAQMQRLLPCAHFHTVFTVPHSLLALWERNRAWFTRLLFDSARACLLQLLADPRHLGATPGILMSLHTWGRTLSHHPHVHCLVTAGGLDSDGAWRATRPGWLLPVKPLQILFRGKLLDGLWRSLEQAQLQLPQWTTAQTWQQQIKSLYRKHFNVEIRPPYEHGRGVVLYLAKYAKGGPLPADRPLYLRNGRLRMPYTDHRDGRSKILELELNEFISRVLWHAPPRGVHTTRHAGLYSIALRGQHALAASALSGITPPAQWPKPSPPAITEPARQPTARMRCPNCQGPLLRTAFIHPRTSQTPRPAHQNGGISLHRPYAPTGPP